MFCTKCGKELQKGETVCSKCGNNIESPGNDIKQMKEEDIKNSISYEKMFIRPDEHYIASLGDNYLNSYLASKKIKCCIAILSSYRIYLYGTIMDDNNGSFSRERTEKIVNVEDITGTGFVYSEPGLWKLIIGILLTVTGIVGILYILPLVLLIPGLLLITSYLTDRGSTFFIEYAGGYIRFDASIYGIEESQDFHKQIRRIQDSLKGKR